MNTEPTRPSLLPHNWQTPASFRRRLGQRVGRQRMMSEDGHLLLVLHAPPRADEDERQGRLFWMAPDGQWRSTERGGGLGALQAHVDEYAERVDALDQMVDAATKSEHYFVALNHLAPLQRAARNMHAALQQARKEFPDREELIDIRDQAYEVERASELLYADASTSLQYAVALQAEAQSHAAHRMSVASHRLNVLAAMFFPIATLSALFGVNLKHTLEETAPPWPFVTLGVVGLLMGLMLVVFMLRPAPPPE